MRKELNNIVVEVLNRNHGEKVIKAFKELGVDTNGNIGNCTSWFYGLINNDFNPYNNDEIKQSNAKIITLDELKSMKPKEDVYPKLMRISEYPINEAGYIERVVSWKYNDLYWVISPNEPNKAVGWKYAQDIEPEPKTERIEIKIPSNPIEILTINGVEYVPKK